MPILDVGNERGVGTSTEGRRLFFYFLRLDFAGCFVFLSLALSRFFAIEISPPFSLSVKSHIGESYRAAGMLSIGYRVVVDLHVPFAYSVVAGSIQG